MLRYETLLLARTEITEAETAMIEKQFDQMLAEAEGRLDTFDKWGKYRLSYPINKGTHGIYMLVRYQVPNAKAASIISDFDRFLKIKCNEIILRHVTVRLKPGAPATYIKPETADEARQGSFDSFFKDNKIENLLNSVESSGYKNNDSDSDSDLENA